MCTAAFHPQTLKLEVLYKTPLLTLGKGFVGYLLEYFPSIPMMFLFLLRFRKNLNYFHDFYLFNPLKKFKCRLYM